MPLHVDKFYKPGVIASQPVTKNSVFILVYLVIWNMSYFTNKNTNTKLSILVGKVIKIMKNMKKIPQIYSLFNIITKSGLRNVHKLPSRSLRKLPGEQGNKFLQSDLFDTYSWSYLFEKFLKRAHEPWPVYAGHRESFKLL